MSDKNRVKAAGGAPVKGREIAVACAEVILEAEGRGVEVDRVIVDALKQSILEFCSKEDGLDPDTLAIATITATIGKTVDLSYVRGINLSAIAREKGGEA